MKINFYLNGIKVQPPANFKELVIEVNYDKDIIQQQVTTNKWRFVRENADVIKNFIEAGITGGVGVLEGLPFKIELEHKGTKVILFNGFLDLTDGVELSCNDIIATAKEKKGIDWLNDNADGFTFEYLDSLGLIDHNKYVAVPYCISDLPETRDIIITTLTLTMLTQEILREIDYYTSKAPNLANPFTATVAIEIALHAVYTVALLLMIVKMIADLINYTIQPVKYHAGMYVKDLFEIGAKKMGYTFSSTIFSKAPFNSLVIIPEKRFQSTDKGLLGFKQPDNTQQKGYYNGTFGDFVRTFKSIFNAKVLISGSTMYFERRDFSLSNKKYVIPALRNDFYALNTEDFRANTLIRFTTDINEKNSIKDYTGNSCYITVQPIKTINKDMVLMKNLEQVIIPFALVRRKTSLTFPEQLVKVFAESFSALVNGFIAVFNAMISAINAVINFFNKLVNAIKALIKIPKAKAPQLEKIKYVDLGATIDDRIGMMLLENDFIDVPKLVLIDENKTTPRKTNVSATNRTTVNAKYLYDNYHFINSFVLTNKKHNQYYKCELKNVPFCFDDYQLVKNDNIITDKNVNFALIDSLRWDVYGQKAEILYRVNKQYTTNIKAVITENNGK